MAADHDQIEAVNEHMAAQLKQLQQQLADLKHQSIRSAEEHAEVLARLRQSEDQLQAANEHQREELAAAEAERKQLETQLEHAVAGTGELGAARDAARRKIAELEADNLSLRERLSAAEEDLKSRAAADHKNEAEDFANQAAMAALERELQQLQQASGQKIEELNQVNQQAQSQVAAAMEESDRLREQLGQLETEFARSQQSLTNRIAALGESESQWKSKACDLELQLGAARVQAAQLQELSQKQLRELVAEQSQTQAQLSIAEITVQRLQDRIRDLERKAALGAEAAFQLSEVSVLLEQSRLANSQLIERLEATSRELELAGGQQGEALNQSVAHPLAERGWIGESPQQDPQLDQHIERLTKELEDQISQHRQLTESYSLIQHWLEQERETSQELKASIHQQRLRMIETEEELESLRRKRSSRSRRSPQRRATATRKGSRASSQTRVAKKTKQTTSKSANDDLCKIEGIGPKIRTVLVAAKISTFRKLSNTSTSRLQTILASAGSAYSGRDVSTWAKQAKLAADQRWRELERLQQRMARPR